MPYRIINFIYTCLSSTVHEIRAHRLRSFLSLLGVIVGTASFIVMVALGEMNKSHTEAFVDEIGGINQINIWPKQPMTPVEMYNFQRSPGHSFKDVDSIYNAVPDLDHAYKRRVQFQLYFTVGYENYLCGFVGINKEFLGRVKLIAGRMISDDEYASGKPVCLLSSQKWEQLKNDHGYTFDDISGRYLYVAGVNAVKVIGVITKEIVGEEWYWYRNALFVPLKFMEKEVAQRPSDGFDMMGVRASRGADVLKTQELIAAKLKSLHRGVADFEFSNRDWIKEASENAKKVNSTFLIITVLCLFVGGLNIMNVMLASISSRVREIGLRQALGASPVQVFLQFMFEAVFLSLIGGIIGCIGGYWLYQAAGSALQESMHTDMIDLGVYHLITGISVSVLSGTLFGFYPAVKAIMMKPVTALYNE